MAPTKMTVQAVAADMLVDQERVLAWIHAGELQAVNVASPGACRPRWRILRTALDEFMTARRNKKPEPETQAPQRKRRQQESYVKYFAET